MYSLCITQGLAEAQTLLDLMRRIDPSGTHNRLDDNDASCIIADTKPDILWLSADTHNLELAGEVRRTSPETNVIFVADDTDNAYDAIRVHASGYIIRPLTEGNVRAELDDLRHPVSKAGENGEKLRIQCFGNFEVFSKGKRVRFARSLSKEAMAYLVDRRGAGCTVGEICAVLWDDRLIDTNLKSQCRVIMASLKKDLEAVGAGDVLIKGWNSWGIDTGKVACDYYDFLSNKAGLGDTYRGEYLEQYSWAEMTSGSLYHMTAE